MNPSNSSIKGLLKTIALGGLISMGASAQATLVDRGGGLIYDTVLNSTWLKDALYVQTDLNIPFPAQLNWTDAKAWVAQLSYFDSVRNVTYTDWRLPKISPLNGSFFQFGTSTGGNTDDGYSISAPGTPYAGSTASELAYMYYNNLGNIPLCSTAGFSTCGDPRTVPFNAGPFTNLLQAGFWFGSDAELPFAPPDAWAFDMGDLYGLQGGFNGDTRRTAWAVRDGDVAAVPEPGTGVLMGVALFAGMTGWRLRNRRKPLPA
jgi:hypothetical protein